MHPNNTLHLKTPHGANPQIPRHKIPPQQPPSTPSLIKLHNTLHIYSQHIPTDKRINYRCYCCDTLEEC